MNRGDVILVDFPFSDRTGSKVRPALVVQADGLNARLDDTIVALITSSNRRMTGSPTHVPVDLATLEGRQTGLRIPSIVQCENLITIDQSFAIRALGSFSPALMRQVNIAIKAALDVP